MRINIYSQELTDEVQVEVTLLPCPFCGGEAVVESPTCGFRVHCLEPECDAAGPWPTDCTEAEAITAWNTRHQSASPSGLVEDWLRGDWFEKWLDATEDADESLMATLEALRGRVECTISAALTDRTSEVGYKRAWQEIADLLDIPAQAVSPREVHERQVMPALRAALSTPVQADGLVEAAQFLVANLKGAAGSVTADYGEVVGEGFQMMTMCPEPERLADAINRLPYILSALQAGQSELQS